MYKYKRFYEIYDHQLLKTQALYIYDSSLKERKTQDGWFLLTQGHPKPGS